jgi:hypothetical protein
VTLTVALGTIADCGSLTFPLMPPVTVAWANTWPMPRKTQNVKAAKTDSEKFFVIGIWTSSNRIPLQDLVI